MFTFTVIAVTVLWALYAVFLKTSFNKSLGLFGYFIVIGVVGYQLAFSFENVSLNTSLQVLPVVVLYISWFWRTKISRLTFAITILFLTGSILLSPVIGADNGFPWVMIIHSFLTVLFTYSIGAFLRRRLMRRATVDQLTGAKNFKGILDFLEQNITKAVTNQLPLTVAVIDFDNFKTLNDSKGHAYGDSALRSEVLNWKTVLRKTDRVGRLGGDEFLIIFPNTGSKEAAKILQTLVSISSFSWSWGMADLSPKFRSEQLLATAYKNLYSRKKFKKRKKVETARYPNLNENPRVLKADSALFEAVLVRKADFSVVNFTLPMIVVCTLLATIFLKDIPIATGLVFQVNMLLTILMCFLAVFSFFFGHKSLHQTTYIIGISVMLTYLVVIIFSTNLYHATIGLFGTSLVALYFGIRLGNRISLLLQVTFLLLAGYIMFIKHWNDVDHDMRIILIALVVYAVISQLFLFETGSNLYFRSEASAYRDPLTTVLNRHGLEEFGAAALNRAIRRGYPLSVAVLDCVDFKKINDTIGHSEANVLLRQTAIYLADNVGDEDIVARLGGDEFAIIMPFDDRYTAESKLKHILSGSPLVLTVGIATRLQNEDINCLLAEADQNMYAERGIWI